MMSSYHGMPYEIYLATHVLIRAIRDRYDFKLKTYDYSIGGKFDDVIFRYPTIDETAKREKWRFRCLLTKLRGNLERGIKSTDLFHFSGDFGLLKYYQSYLSMVAKGFDIEDCIICTNIDMNIKDLAKNGISLVPDPREEKILDFTGYSAYGEEPARYRLQLSDEKRIKLEEEWSDCYILAKELEKCAIEKKEMEYRMPIFQVYHVPLVEENVIDLRSKQFHADFINGLDTLSPGAQLLRHILCRLIKEEKWKEWQFKLNKDFGNRKRWGDGSRASLPSFSKAKKLEEFFTTLLFVVNMPDRANYKNFLMNNVFTTYFSDEDSEAWTEVIISKITDRVSTGNREWLTSDMVAAMLLATGAVKESALGSVMQ